MAKFYQSKKWKKGALTALSLAMTATLSLGFLSACRPAEQEEDEESKVAPADTQVIKNGDFEFYSDKLIDDDENGKPLKKLNIISSPDSWSFTSGSPSSDTKSGVIDTADWDYYTKTGGFTFTDVTVGEGNDAKTGTTFASVAEAYANWERSDVSAYDRLKFLDIYKTEISALSSTSDEKARFDKYSYTVDYEDVESFADDFTTPVTPRPGANADEGDTSVLMIHNSRTADDGVRGTAQYYTSSTTITLSAGTAAKVSVWVRTDNLFHYKDTELNARGGAYIGVTNTVGGTTLDQMQIYNINTRGEWKQYTLYVRASTFATSTFRIVLGLGQGSSDDKYYAVDGYAFFDDVEAEIISHSEYETAVLKDAETNTPKDDVKLCTVDSLKKDKQFPVDEEAYKNFSVFALDLYAGFTAEHELLGGVGDASLTEEKSGSRTYTSKDIDPSLDKSANDFAKLTTLGELKNSANEDVKRVYENDFSGDKAFPFGDNNSPVVMLLSSGGAAYTSKLQSMTLLPGERLLVSFFVKTKITSGMSGAGAAVVDGESKTVIGPFDSSTLATVDIDSKSDDPAKKDIYKGWAQCFFFIENDTEENRTFRIELTYGPTTIVGSDRFSYGDGYAAFTNFEIKPLSKAEYSYASAGDRAKKVSLTGGTEETKNFDSVSATAEKDLKQGPALPANFRGVLGGSNFVTEGGAPNTMPNGVYAGLLNFKYADNYLGSEESWKSALDLATGSSEGKESEEWWSETFGNARQPLVIINDVAAAYGYFGETTTVSANSYQRISMRIKASVGAIAHVYLTDVSSAENAGKLIYPDLPGRTYWYDDDGNIVNMDPQDEEFDEKGETLFELQKNGLYKRAGGTDDTLYANLSNYETDSEGNKVTADGTIAYFYDETTERFYAYRDENKNGDYIFNTPVTELPAELDGTSILRYDYTNRDELPGTDITVRGTGDWVLVNFYLHTGSEAKSFRIEVWSGSRDGEQKNSAHSFVFFDNFASATASDYDTLLSETVQTVKDEYNEKNRYQLGDEKYLGKKDELPEEYALYYTFTFYDAATYLRYDETTDEDELGNPWSAYTQSSNSSTIVYLSHVDETDGNATRYTYFLDFSPIDVSVERQYPNDTDTTPDHDHDTDEESDPANIWLLISSGILAVVLIAVIAIVIVRRLVKKFGRRTARVKATKDLRVRPKKGRVEEPAPEETDEE